jgi:hypothetical protein
MMALEGTEGQLAQCGKCGNNVQVPAGPGSNVPPLIPPQQSHAYSAPTVQQRAPAQMAPAYTPAPVQTAGGIPKFVPALLLLAALGVGGYFAYMKWFAVGNPALASAAKVNKSSYAVGAWNKPEQNIIEAAKYLEDTSASDAEFKMKWTQSKKDAQDVFGFDVTSPDAYAKAGFDVKQPITMALLQPLGKGSKRKAAEPAGVVFSFGVTDPKVAITTIQNVAKQKNITFKDDTSAEPTVHTTGDDMALAFQNNRLYLIGANKDERVPQLREFLKTAKENSLQDSEIFKNTLKGLPGGDQSLFINLKSIADTVPDTTKAMKDVLGLGMSLGARDFSMFALLSDQAEIKKHLVAGSASKDLISQLEKPIFALTFSLAEPMKLVRHIAETSVGIKAVVQMNNNIKAATDLDPDAVDELLKNGAGGILAFMSKGPNDPPGVMFFLKVSDKEKAKSLLGKVNPEATKKDTSTGVLYQSQNGLTPGVYGLIGDYIVGGTAITQIEGLSKGEKSTGWTPKCGGTELFAGEIAVKDSLDALKKSLSFLIPAEAANSPSQKLIKIDRVGWSVSSSGSGVLLSTTYEGDFKISLSSLLLSILASEGLQHVKSDVPAPAPRIPSEPTESSGDDSTE